MLREDFDRIRKLPNSEKILKRFFALEETPKYFNKFTPPSGVEFEMNYSIVKDNKWGAGGALQFQLGERVPAEWFEENRRLIKGDIQ